MIELLFKQISKTFRCITFGVTAPMLSKNAGILRTNYPITDGGDKEESSYKKIFCKYDYGYKAAPDELCGITGVYKGYLQSMEKNT